MGRRKSLSSDIAKLVGKSSRLNHNWVLNPGGAFFMSQQEQSLPPWVQSPFELIRHASEHLILGGDTDRRIALIGFDNAIEVCIDVFLSLHPKVRGGVEISNDETEKAKRNYHTKLEFFYKYAQDKEISVEIPEADIIWYHDLRNKLYHSGNGLIPETHVLVGARAAALFIFKSLFNLDATFILESGTRKIYTINNEILGQWLGEDIKNLHLVGTKPRRDAELIRSILRTQGHILLMHNSITERFCRVCELPNSGYGIQVVEWDITNTKWREITSFSKNESKRLEQVQNYLANAGYIVYTGELPRPISI
jgi:hypothetical protein